jgi:Tat protein secretion system quality control protein TatD with DNase activity
VGECGLDKFAGGRSPPGSGEPPDLELQDSIFRAQLALARDLGRGVTVHCVKRVDAVAAAIRAERPPRVAFHGFNGSPESASVLIRAVEAGGGTAFFGINTAHASKKTPQLVASLPEASLLAESDASGEFEARVADATKLIAEARDWSLTEAEERLAGNARAFLL